MNGKSATQEPRPADGGCRITALRTYPVKGCRGLDLTRATLAATGLEWDRHWLFVDERGRFFTQREVPGLARIDASVERDSLRLAASGHPTLHCPLVEEEAEPIRVTIWNDTCLARPSRLDTREWLRAVTGTPGQLVRGIPAHARTSNPTYAGPGRAEYFFADAFAVLVANEASLADLNERLEEPLPMARFRPNVVVDGLEAFEEDGIEWFARGPLRLKSVKPCTRCIVTTTDQATGDRDGSEPLRTLRTFRWSPALKGVAFGVNAIIAAGAGSTLAVGERLDITPRAPADSSPLWTVRPTAPER